MSNTTISNHYIPVAYLKHFFNEKDKLFLYMKGKKFFDNNSQKILEKNGEKSLSSIMTENYFYHHSRIKDKNHIENYFKTECDDIYDGLINTIKNGKLDEVFYENLIKVIVLMHIRTPMAKHNREENDNIARKEIIKSFNFSEYILKNRDNIIKKIKQEHNIEISEKDVNESVEDFKNGNFDFEYEKEFYLSDLDVLINTYSFALSSMSFMVVEAKERGFFISSDNPMVYFVPKNNVGPYDNCRNLMSKYVELYFPLSRKYCVLGYRSKNQKLNDRIIKVDRSTCRRINESISNVSFDYIISPYRASFLYKYIKNYIPYPIKIVCE